jgi:ABC-2 type transport system ATP-binding protein
MKMLTCYLPPTSGTAQVEGYDIGLHSMDVRRHIGYLPEQSPLYLDMNVLEYLSYAASLYHVKGELLRSRLNEMVDVCGLGGVRHKDIGELSKGFRQRVGLAQAMIHDPEVLVLDEPTTGLDPNQIVEIRNLIRQLGKEKTVLLSTHILSEVQATCDRVIIINKGVIAADGTPEQLQEQFHGEELISIELKVSPEHTAAELMPLFRSLAFVTSVEYNGQEGDVHRIVLHTQKGSDIREAVFRRVVEQRWVLLEMNRSITSMEEIFRNSTAGEDDASELPAKETATAQPGEPS